MKTITIDGANFDNIDGFYKEAYAKLAPQKPQFTRGSLDGFSDILNGGFGAHDDGEQVTLVWKGSAKSKDDLGYDATAKQLEEWIQYAHPDSLAAMQERLDNAKNHQGPTIFDDLIKIIEDHKTQIQLDLA
jgi:RNAse (barnase) inhibitor barstar